MKQLIFNILIIIVSTFFGEWKPWKPDYYLWNFSQTGRWRFIHVQLSIKLITCLRRPQALPNSLSKEESRNGSDILVQIEFSVSVDYRLDELQNFILGVFTARLGKFITYPKFCEVT